MDIDLQKVNDRIDADILAARNRLASAQKKVEDLERKRDGIRALFDYIEEAQSVGQRDTGGLTEQIYEIANTMEGTFTVADLREALSATGQEAAPDQIRNSLQYLFRSGRMYRPGRGVWSSQPIASEGDEDADPVDEGF